VGQRTARADVVIMRRRSGDQVDGCESLLRDVMDADQLPWVVLFASALELRGRRRRARRIAYLADAYRQLFPQPGRAGRRVQ
jgi:hypothetical protein